MSNKFKVGDIVKRVDFKENFNTGAERYGCNADDIALNHWVVTKSVGDNISIACPRTNKQIGMASLSWDANNFELVREEIMVSNSVNKNTCLPVRVVFQYDSRTKKGATILWWSEKKEDKTVLRLADGDKFDKVTGVLWGIYMHINGLSRTKTNTLMSYIKKPNVKAFLIAQITTQLTVSNKELLDTVNKLVK